MDKIYLVETASGTPALRTNYWEVVLDSLRILGQGAKVFKMVDGVLKNITPIR